jgi:DNA-binding MarR family transcriptional regulator
MRQYHLLRILKEVGALDVKTIAKRLGQAQNTSSELVWRMTEKGLLNSEKDKNDRRRTVVNITKKGEEELFNMEKEIDNAFEKFCKYFLKDKEIDEFYRCSEKLYEISKKVIKKLEER